MGDKKYLNFLAKFGISSAHPGGMPLTKAIFERVNFTNEDHVLDVGCGTGETSVYLAKVYGCNVTAVDLHPMMITHAKNRIIEEGVDVQLIQANVEQLPLEENRFDKVIAESVTVFTDVKKSLAEYRRVLKPGGLLLDIEMTGERPLTKAETAEVASVYEITKVLTHMDWVDAIHEAGFTDIVGHNGVDIVSQLSDLPNASGFEFTEAIDLEAFQAWLNHIQIMDKYRGILNFRVYMAKA